MRTVPQGSLIRRFAPFALALLVAAGAQAATVSSTLRLDGTATMSGTSFVNTGQVSLTNLGSGGATVAGTFSSTINLLTDITGSSATSRFTITLSGGTLTGTYTEPLTILYGSSGNASATITGGTGSYANYTGSFPTLAGSSSSTGATSYSFTFSGSGTMNTSGGGTTTPTTTIAAVQDAASNTAKIAQGSLFSVYGTNLSPSTQGLTTFPWPTNSNGVKVTFTPTAGGAGIDTYLNYVGTGQINALLPSTVPVGTYNVIVTSGTATSPPFSTQVVASKLGLFTQDQSGTGLAVVQNYISQSEVDVNRLTTGTYNGSLSSPARPGQVLIAWGTGLSAWAQADNAVGVVHDFRGSLTIAAVVGGVSIPVDFAGRAGYAGVDQINFTLPSNVPTGCSVTLQISVAGVLSAATSIAIAPAGATACVQSGYTTQQLQTLDQGGTITSGGFSLSQSLISDPSFGSFTSASAGGAFSQRTAFQLSSSGGSQSAILANSGGCVVTRSTDTGSTVSAGRATGLDAGTVTLTGPAGSNLNNQQLTKISNAYLYPFGTPGLSNTSLMQGTYTLNGAGGNDVGPFNVSITLGPLFTLNSPLPSTVTESAGLTLNWTGGNSSDVVMITGSSDITTGTGANKIDTVTGFVCTTTAGQKTFTVPASILTLLPTFTAAQVTADTASGGLGVTSIATPGSTFNATLKKDSSTIPSGFGSIISISGLATFQ